jgi:asparagine synthase (glutamine-hydrolysing)
LSAIAGYIPSAKGPADPACKLMLAALQPFGPDRQDSAELGNVAFGRALRPVLPEDEFDRQPLICPLGRYLLVADGRIDNRDEIAAELNVGSGDTRRLSDAGLLLLSWTRFKFGSLDRLLGDFALAVWDGDERTLTLARSPLSSRSLFYHWRPERIAFASMPHGLFALPDVPKRLNRDQVAVFAAGLPTTAPASFFEDVFAVRHGEAIEFAEGKRTGRRFWDAQEIGPGQSRHSDYGEALRHELDRAVSAQLRRRSGLVGTHLSAGRDSGAVTASAALALHKSDDTLVALTGAPSAGFSGPAVGNRIADESSLAAVTAAAYRNIRHIVCRSGKRPLAPELRKLSASHHHPIPNPSALHWEAEIFDQAREQGVTVLLAGFMGNYSISTNGPHNLRDIWLDQGGRAWWKHARRVGGGSWDRWRSIGNITFGPDLPRTLHSLLLRLGGRSPRGTIDAAIWREPVRRMAEELQASQAPYEGMNRGYREFRRFHILEGDQAQSMTLAVAGIDQRDPTSDRRLVELCLAIPPDLLASRPVEPSPVYLSAFGDRIPEPVLHNRRRGYQGADWYEMFEPAEVGALFEQLAGNPAVEALLDMEAIRARIASWPRSGDRNWKRLAPYRTGVLRALALADFVDFHFPR